VRKNVSLPAWLSRKADEAGLSLSKVLQEALLERLG
jgi:DNA polymerase III delta subunit